MKKYITKAKDLTERHGQIVFMTGAYWYVDTLTLSHHLANDLKVAEHVHRTGSNVLFYTSPLGTVEEVVPTHFSAEEWTRNVAYKQFRAGMDQLLKQRHLYSDKTFYKKAAAVKRNYANMLQGVLDLPL